MAALPRVITVDPTGAIARIVRSALDLLDLSVVQVDVPEGAEALEELQSRVNLVVTAFDIDDNMRGFEFALRVKQASKDTSVIILGDVDDPDELDEETALDSPFVYLSRPVDSYQFLRVLVAGLESHEAMVGALNAPSGGNHALAAADMGPVPQLDINQAQTIVDSLLTDLGAMAVLMSSRSGETLLERGAVGYIDRERLTHALLPIMQTSIGVRDIVGGQIWTVQLYDGDDYDVFVLSVGLHHFLCVIFDGQMGARQFGLVNRFGRRAVEDLIALIGANAFFIQPAASRQEEQPRARKSARKQVARDDEPVQLAHAEIEPAEETAKAEVVMQQLEPIEDLDLDNLFGDDMDLDEDLFDPDKLEELAKESAQQSTKGAVDWDQAQQLGILKN
jgi:hypothetical protein